MDIIKPSLDLMKAKIPDNVLNPKLYQQAKSTATAKFGEKSSIYRSMYMVKEYKRLGGKYSGSKKEAEKGGVRKWLDEEWIQVIPYVQNNKKVVCGSKSEAKKGCRPLKRVDKTTPITIKELLKIHPKKKLLDLAKRKKNDMSLRINWKSGTVYKSS